MDKRDQHFDVPLIGESQLAPISVRVAIGDDDWTSLFLEFCIANSRYSCLDLEDARRLGFDFAQAEINQMTAWEEASIRAGPTERYHADLEDWERDELVPPPVMRQVSFVVPELQGSRFEVEFCIQSSPRKFALLSGYDHSRMFSPQVVDNPGAAIRFVIRDDRQS